MAVEGLSCYNTIDLQDGSLAQQSFFLWPILPQNLPKNFFVNFVYFRVYSPAGLY